VQVVFDTSASRKLWKNDRVLVIEAMVKDEDGQDMLQVITYVENIHKMDLSFAL